MTLLGRFYKTRNLANNGVFIVVVILIWIAAGNILIPESEGFSVDRQIFDLKGTTLKYDDEKSVSHFFKSIKENDGYLCLGTSESGHHKEGNYYDFINNDPEINSGFLSVLAGAGRTCGIHIPLFLNHKEDVDSLNLIYFINPIYWRLYFSEVSEYYWDRYNNYRVCSSVSLSNMERSEFYKPVEDYFKLLDEDKKISLKLEDIIRSNRRTYFQDLRYNISSSSYYEDLNYLVPHEKNLESFPSFGEVDYDKMDTTWNVLKSYLPDKGFRPIKENDPYRYEELTAFVKLCKHLNVNRHWGNR